MSDGIILRQGINSLAGNNEIKGNLNISGDTVVGGIISGDGSGITNIPISGTTNLQNTLDGKTDNIYFTAHTGDTTIHYTKSSINLSDLGSSAHTHPISEVVNLQTELDSKLETTTFNTYTGSVVDVFVSSGNADAGTQQLSFTNTTGGTFNVTNSAALFADNDINVTGGTYDNNTGCVTFTTNSGTTFDVCGFVTGLTDTFVTGGTLSGSDLILERNSGVDVSGIDLSGLVSGKLDITVFNTYTGDTETALNSKLDTTTFNTYSGSVQTELDGKVETSLFNTYTGDTETTLNTKIETASNVGGANNVFSGKSGTDLQFRTISGGTNTTVTTVDGVIKIDVAGTDNFYVTGGTLSDGTLTLERNDNNSVVVTGFTDGCQSIVTTVGAGNTELYSLPLSANTGAFFIYSISGLTGARTGTLTTVFSGNSANIGDLSTDDIGGSTSGVSFNMTVVSNEAKLNVSADTGTWSVDIIPNICGATTRIAGGEVNTASNIGSGEGIFSGKSGTDLQFKSLTSTGGTVTISSTGSTINLESSGGGGSLSIGDSIAGGTNNSLLLKDSSGNLDSSDNIIYTETGTVGQEVVTISVDSWGIKDGTINAVNAAFPTTYYTKLGNSGKIEGAYNGTKWSMESDGTYNYYRSVTAHPCIFQTSNGTYTQLWLDANSNKVKIGAFVAPSATLDVRGEGSSSGTTALLVENNSATTLFEVKDDGTVVIPNIGTTTPVTNLAVDASGNVVSGTTGGGGSAFPYTGDAEITGSLTINGDGNTSGTTNFTLKNSDGDILLEVGEDSTNYVEFNDGYFQVAPTSTSNTLGTFSNQSFYIGTGIAAAGTGSVTRVYAQGQNHTLAGTANLNDSFILGSTHTVAQGNRSFVLGTSINIGDLNDSFVGGNTINGSTADLSKSFIWNATSTTTLLNDTSSGIILIGSSASGFKGDNITGIGGDHYSALATLSKHYAFGDRIRGTVSRQTVIGMGTDSGTMLQLASGAANGVHFGVASNRTGFGLVKATAKSMTAAATETTGLAYLGTGLPVALNVANTGDGAFWIEDVDTAPTANVANAGALYNNTGSLTWWDGTTAHNLTTESMVIAVSDESTALTSGTNKLTFRMPYAFTLTEVRASLTTSGTTGGLTTVDINESGVSILSTKLTIDQGEKTSTTAATPPVISDTALADDAEITVDIDTVTTGGGETGLKIYLIGYRV